MKNKLTIIFGMVLLVGLVAAAGTITKLTPSLDISNFIAGGTTSTEFSFDYEDDFENNASQSLVLRVNVSSLEQACPLPLGDCSVWPGDFQLSGFIEEYSLFDLFLGTIYPLKCVEETAEFRVQQGLLYTETTIPDGTFYCYDPNDYIDMLKLDRRDKVNLSISSNPALYPGTYNVTIELMEMELDTSPPEIEFLIAGYVYDEVTPIHMKFNVTDMYEIQTVQYKITNPLLSDDNYYDSGWITTTFNEGSGLYEDYFDTSEYGLFGSGKYWIRAYACDVLGNCREM